MQEYIQPTKQYPILETVKETTMQFIKDLIKRFLAFFKRKPVWDKDEHETMCDPLDK